MTAFVDADGLRFYVLFGLASWSLCAPIPNSWQLEISKPGFRLDGIVKTMFSQTLFFNDSRRDLFCFSEAYGFSFSDLWVLGRSSEQILGRSYICARLLGFKYKPLSSPCKVLSRIGTIRNL